MDEPIVPQDAAFKIELPSFEGPLDLLLHLIRKHELEILDLPISFVTERYLEYLKLMNELDLDVASEYLLMAATLAHIKSKSLLPPNPNDVDEDEEQFMEDPRAELIRRLLEYQKYKEVADELGNRSVAGRDVFGRGLPAPAAEGEAPLAETSLFKLLDAFEAILKRAKGKVALEVSTERISIQERMTEITEDLSTKRACTFEELFAGDFTRYDVVVTLLALLEMTKMHVVRLYQAEPSSPLHIQYALFAPEAPTIPPPGEMPTSSGELTAPPMVALEDELKTSDDGLSPDARMGDDELDEDDELDVAAGPGPGPGPEPERDDSEDDDSEDDELDVAAGPDRDDDDDDDEDDDDEDDDDDDDDD